MAEMTTSRLEAFSDGVIAIIITIMVLELHAPAQPTVAAFLKMSPVFISYALSFLVAAIMWVNHHHFVHAVRTVTPQLLWSNLYMLFWMSLIPFVTEIVGKNYHEPVAVALYGLDLTLCSTGFYLLRRELIRQCRHDLTLTEYHQNMQRKGTLASLLYLSSLPLAFASVYASFFIFALVPAMYFLPETFLSSGTE
jgi:uncharacterized membrane protein